MDTGSRRFLAVMRGRAPDGVALEADLRPGLQADPPSLPALPGIDSGDEAGVLAAARAWLAWWDGLFSEPFGGQEAWVPEKLEYQFRVSAPAGDGGELVLAAQEYYTGELDWYAFDVQNDASLGGEGGPGEVETTVQAVVPTAVDFEGMPAPRWWEFEDSRVDFGQVDAAPEDLARLLLLEFALVYGNDWLMIPVSLEVGSLCRIRSLIVTDTFGERVAVPPSPQPADPAASWGLYYLAETDRPLTHRTAPAEQIFFLPPTLATSLESPPVEEVLLIRDEMANMAWAIERKVQGADGRPVDRFEVYQDEQRRQPVIDESPAEGAAVVYHLASTVPDHWIPLLPVRIGADQRSIALQRGAMLNPETGEGILARGRILTPARRLIIEDEEVPRVGVQVIRGYQHTRWANGASLLWMGRHKRPGRGEGSSGLRFRLDLRPAAGGRGVGANAPAPVTENDKVVLPPLFSEMFSKMAEPFSQASWLCQKAVRRQTACGWLSLPGRRDYHAHLKHQGAIPDEFLPLCDDVALQRAEMVVIHLRHGARERGALHVLPEKFFRCREAQRLGVGLNRDVVEAGAANEVSESLPCRGARRPGPRTRQPRHRCGARAPLP